MIPESRIIQRVDRVGRKDRADAGIFVPALEIDIGPAGEWPRGLIIHAASHLASVIYELNPEVPGPVQSGRNDDPVCRLEIEVRLVDGERLSNNMQEPGPCICIPGIN